MNFKQRVLSYLGEAVNEPAVRALYRIVEDILFDNYYDIFGKMNTHDSGTGFSLYVRGARKYKDVEDKILVRVSDHPSKPRYGRDVPNYTIIISKDSSKQDASIRKFESALKERIELGKEGKLNNLKEGIDVFVNPDKKKEGIGGRKADKSVKDKGTFNKFRVGRSKKSTYKNYDDVRLQTDDSEMNDVPRRGY